MQLFDRDVEFAAAPDVFPPDRFNAGVFVAKPSTKVLDDMLSKVSELPSYDGGDTGDKYTRSIWGGRGDMTLCPGVCSHSSIWGEVDKIM